MNGVDSMNPSLESETIDSEVESKVPPKQDKVVRSLTPIDDSSPDPLSQTDRYRLSMPYADRL